MGRHDATKGRNYPYLINYDRGPGLAVLRDAATSLDHALAKIKIRRKKMGPKRCGAPSVYLHGKLLCSGFSPAPHPAE